MIRTTLWRLLATITPSPAQNQPPRPPSGPDRPAPGPWDNDVLAAPVVPGKAVEELATFERAGIWSRSKRAIGAWLLCGMVAHAMPPRFFAPYVDATLYPAFDIAGTAQSQGIRYFTLAFVVAAGDTTGADPLTLAPSAVPAWGGQNTLRVNTEYFKSAILALRAQGGDVMLSFGGANGTELAGLYSNPYHPVNQATLHQQRETANVQHLKQAYQFVIDTYALTHIDFDVEGGWVAHPYSIQLRAKAVKALQDDAIAAGRTLQVWLTLPALPSGLDSNGRNVLAKTLDAGARVDGINIMAMDYGDTSAPVIDPATGHTVTIPNIPPRENDDPAVGLDSDGKGLMGDYAIQAADALFAQIKSAHASHGIALTDAEAWRKVGVTPMLGVNDVQTEVFDPSEAAELFRHSLSRDLGMISFWSITRDRPPPAGMAGQVAPTHHGLGNPAFTFSRLHAPFSGTGGEAVYASDASVTEGDAGTQALTLTLLRLPAAAESRTVSWHTADGTAVAGFDYQAANGSVTFGPNETEQTIVLTVSCEAAVEGDETFSVRFATTSGVPIPSPTATVTILDDDTPPAASINDVTVAESAATATFTVTLSRPVKSGLTGSVAFATAPATAGAGNDFTTTSGTLTFTGSQTSKTLTVPILNDAVPETDELFLVTLSSPANLAPGDAQGVGTIQANDSVAGGGFSFDLADNWGSGWRAFLSFTNPGPATWNPWQLSFDAPWILTTWGVTATRTTNPDGSYHYVVDPPSWSTSLAAGETFSWDFSVSGSPVSPPVNVMANGVPLGTQTPGVSINDVTTAEGDSGGSNAAFNVTLSAAHSAEIQVAYAVVGGTAATGADFSPTSGTLVFSPGQITKTIHVPVIGDLSNEDHETVFVYLAGVDGQALPRFTDFKGQLTITDDDEVPALTAHGTSIIEGDGGTRTAAVTLRLSRVPKSGETITAFYQTGSGTAVAGGDFQGASGTVTFTAGSATRTVNLTIRGDHEDERLELFRLELSDPAGCILADAGTDVHIIDDDTPGSLGGRRVVAYVDGTGGGLSLPPANRVTHVLLAFANLDSSGNWLPGAAASQVESIKFLRATNPDLKILLSIGGWTWSENFSSVAADAAKRAAFAQSAANTVDSLGIDGVDIDWEWPGAQGDSDTPPGPNDSHNFTLLLQGTRAALDTLGSSNGRHYELTAFTGGGNAQISALELGAVGQALDFINVQGYDLRGPWDGITGHHTGLHHNPGDSGGADLNHEAILNRYLAAGIPPSKLLLGSAFFGHSFSGVPDANHGLFQSHNGGGYTMSYSQIAASSLPASRRFWDDIAKVPWLHKAATGEFISYDDPRSLAEKASFARNQGFGGVYFWQAGGDSADWQLLTSVHDSLTSAPVADSDLDGIPDEWENNSFGNLTTADAQSDHDRDGQSDLHEWVAGTNPVDPADRLRIHSIGRSGGSVTLGWPVKPGKTCSVHYSADLQAAPWITIASGLTSGSFSDTDPVRLARPRGYYRVTVP